MQYKFFTIPAAAPGEAEEALNGFLRAHRVLTVSREFLADAANPRWCLAVEYLAVPGPGKGDEGSRQRRDYKEILPPEDFALFVRLREWRKAVAEREGVPVYTIFTNEQLARIAGGRIAGKGALGEIDGVGEGRVNKYGDEVIALVRGAAMPGEEPAASGEGAR